MRCPPVAPHCLQGAQALEIVQWVVEDPTDQHIWVQGIRKAFSLQLGLDVLVNNDRTKVFFKPDVSRDTCGCACPAPRCSLCGCLPCPCDVLVGLDVRAAGLQLEER